MLRRIAIFEKLFLGVLNIDLSVSSEEAMVEEYKVDVWRGTYLLMSNIGIVLSGRILLDRNHHPAENGVIGKNRLISA
jgi:hypothetical protein